MPTRSLDSTAAAYDDLAPFYDDFVRDYDHLAWGEAVERVARAHGVDGRAALDLACGTGKSTLALLELGYAATGCDISTGMLRCAREALPEHVPLVEADLRDLPELGRFDL